MRPYIHIHGPVAEDASGAVEVRFEFRTQPTGDEVDGEMVEVAPELVTVLANGEPLDVSTCPDEGCLQASGTVEVGATVSIAAIGLPDHDDPVPVRIRVSPSE